MHFLECKNKKKPTTTKKTQIISRFQKLFPTLCVVVPDLLRERGFAAVLVQVGEQADFVAVLGPQRNL